jgi:CRP/FNR family cyclic AMP-dependent transcriptional regulator
VHPNRISLLQGMPLFGAISESALEFLVSRSLPVGVAAGAWFFREGDQATGLFVLEQGRVVISRQWQGHEFELSQLGPGDCFGEMALMDFNPRSASARAVQDCQALEIRPGALHELFERDCEQFALIQMNMGREVCRRLRATDDLLFAVQAGNTRA